jgi:hypothetical protein
MQKAHLNLIKYALAQGCTISVWDGEEWQVKRSTSYKDIKDAAESVDESQLRIRDSEDNKVGWALLSLIAPLNPRNTLQIILARYLWNNGICSIARQLKPLS